MLDEKFSGSMFNNGENYMTKTAVIFENTSLFIGIKKRIIYG